MSKWQKIESAPKDGTVVLAFASEGNMSGPVILWWCQVEECWTDGLGLHYREVTHWMPLPEPPSDG